MIVYSYLYLMDKLEKFYEEEKSKLESYIEYNEKRPKSLYSEVDLRLFNDYIRHSSEWLRKIKRLIDEQ